MTTTDSPQSNLLDRTNVFRREGAPTGLPTPPSERKRVRRVEFNGRDKKRLKFDSPGKENGGRDIDLETDSEDDEGDASSPFQRVCTYSVYGLGNQRMQAGPSDVSRRLESEY